MAYYTAFGPLFREPWLAKLDGASPQNKRGTRAGADYMLVSSCKNDYCAENNGSFCIRPSQNAMHDSTGRTKNIIRIALATACILLLPLLAMQLTDEVAWDLADFVVAGALLFGTGLMYELVAGKSANVTYRLAVGIALATALMLVWMNLAVGLIGSEDNPANLMYVGVLAIGLIGALIARFRPRQMARALFATALAQALVPVIALIIWKPPVASADAFVGVVGVFSVNALFVLLFVASALLFRRASGAGPR